jgi:hypothetical protein
MLRSWVQILPGPFLRVVQLRYCFELVLIVVGQNPLATLVLETPYISGNEIQLGMALGEKLFEESGNITGFKVTKVHPVEGVTIEASFTSEVRGIGRFPSGKNLGSGTMTQYPHGIVDASWQGSFMTTTEGGDQFIWWAHEKSKVAEDGKVKGLTMVTGFTNSQKLAWMNNLIYALESETDLESQRFRTTAYEWR